MSIGAIAYHCHGERQVAIVAVGDFSPGTGELAQVELFRTLTKWLRRNPDFVVGAVSAEFHGDEGWLLTAWGTGPVAEARVTR